MSATRTSNLQRAEKQVTSEPPVDLIEGSGVPTPIVEQPSNFPTADTGPVTEPYPLDRAFHAMLARMTGGISPLALSLAYLDWNSHLAAAPQRQLERIRDVVRDTARYFDAAAHAAAPGQNPWSVIKPQAQDHRFAAPLWDSPPFNLLAQSFLLGERWWHDAATGVHGVAPANEAIVEFSGRQMLDMLAPSNFAATNPEVLLKAFQSGGENYVFG